MAGRVELRDRTGHRGNLAVVLETPTLSFASEKGPPSRWFCQWHGTTPVASHGTTLSIHQHRPKTDSAGPPKPSRRRPHGVQGGNGGPDQRGAQTLAFRRG